MKKIKCAKKDFTEADLPLTRTQMFFDCYKEQFSLIFRVGLLCLLFFSPTMIIWLMHDGYLVDALNALPEQTTERIEAVYLSANMVFGLMELLAAVLFFVLFAGIAQILRQLCWGEPVFFFEDFKKGIRENAGRFAVVGVVLSLFRYLLGLLSNSAYAFLSFSIFALIFVPLGIWVLLQTLYSRLRWGQVIKNAVFYLVRALPMTLLLLVGTVLPFLLVRSFVTLLIAKYLLLLLLALFYVVPVAMVWILYACQTFDICLNKQRYPHIYRKGLRPDASDLQDQK